MKSTHLPNQPPPILLRAAAVWGTTVLTTRVLSTGESLLVGEDAGAVCAKPDDSQGSDLPIRAVGAGWELDARGATGGELVLRGRHENPAELGRSGAPIPIVPGDFGLIQYGNFSVFFQFTEAPRALPKRRGIPWSLVLSFLFSCIAVGGGLALIWAVTTPLGIPKPIELTDRAELAKQFNITLPEPQAEAPSDDKASRDAGSKDSGARDPKPQGGGKKARGAEGKVGARGLEKKTEAQGDPGPALGGMAEVLSSDVGEEVKKTLNTISSVADALGGLRSENLVLGQGQGMGLRGKANGGGGDQDGVPFGSGTLDTGWGAGRGGGYGSGKGGPGRGLGNGRGTGSGTGDGSGGGERQLAGRDAPKPGQGLSPGQIQRVVMSRLGAFRACYESAAARDPTLKGGVTVSFSITPSGSVSAVNVASSSLGNARVEGCITRSFSRLRFPSADKPTNATWPFVFKPSK